MVNLNIFMSQRGSTRTMQFRRTLTVEHDVGGSNPPNFTSRQALSPPPSIAKRARRFLQPVGARHACQPSAIHSQFQAANACGILGSFLEVSWEFLGSFFGSFLEVSLGVSWKFLWEFLGGLRQRLGDSCLSSGPKISSLVWRWQRHLRLRCGLPQAMPTPPSSSKRAAATRFGFVVRTFRMSTAS